ncbi:hypothetical protein [Bacillus safensis]|uniref:hypothetical protein n=1 Tax=Bacillus safensis TaxID=561879 RepID=UPI0022829465|nr:hypothetical protein [Bacillus safensis]MCY7493214.1 hypothetical protein [Bacillus safensis]MED4994146.1 hypothetical protein [Bacillus safensis]
MSEVVEVKVLSGIGWEGLLRERLLINGKQVMDVRPLSECPEDAILERDLYGASSFAGILEAFLREHHGKKVRFIYEEDTDE